MIRFTVFKNNNPTIESTFNKWYPRVKVDETVDLQGLAAHMSTHNSPFSAGVIQGLMTDMVDCIKELLLEGKNVKLDNLAIFSVGIQTKKGADKAEDFSISENIRGVKLRARATGKLSNQRLNLDATLKNVTPATTAEPAA